MIDFAALSCLVWRDKLLVAGILSHHIWFGNGVKHISSVRDEVFFFATDMLSCSAHADDEGSSLTVRAAKLRYRERIESHFQLNDSRRMWQGLKIFHLFLWK